MPKKTKIKAPKFAGAWALAKLSIRDFRADWKPYILILAVITVPSDLASIFTVFASDPMASSYLSMAAIFMNVALIWAIVRRAQTGRAPGLAEAYYDSSIALVRFLLVCVALVLYLLPAGLGAALFSAALASAGSGSIGPELLLIALASLLLASPSFYLIIRYALAPMAVIRDGLRPVAALRASRRLTLGRFWPVAGRYLFLILMIIIISVPTTLVTLGISLIKLPTVATLFFEVVSTFLVLPFANLYLLRLYGELDKS